MLTHLHGDEVDISYSDTIFLKNEHSYAAFMGTLSNIYMKAHASSVCREEPYSAAIIIDSKMMRPFKNQPESSFERLKFIISKLKTPRGGISLGLFLSDDDIFSKDSTVGLKHTVSHCWPMNVYSTKQIITANLPPPQLKGGKNSVRYFSANDLKSILTREVKFVDYYNTIKQVFSHFEKSKVHICYQGGTAWLSVSAGIPTIIVHAVPPKNDLHFKSKLFGQDLGNINILDSDNRIRHVRTHPLEYHVHINKLRELLQNLHAL